MTDAASVRVAVRVRPMSERENSKDTLPVVTASTEKAEVTLIRGGSAGRQQRQTYNFDQVHSSFSSQRDVFESTRPLVMDVLSGYEATVRARHACTAESSTILPCATLSLIAARQLPVEKHDAAAAAAVRTLAVLYARSHTLTHTHNTRVFVLVAGLRLRPDWLGQDAHNGGQPHGRGAKGSHPSLG